MSILSLAKFASLQKIATPLTFQKVIGPSTDQPILQKLILDSLAESGININRTNTGRINLENVTDKTVDKFNSILRQKKFDAGLPRSRYETEKERGEIKKFVQDKIKNKQYVSLPIIYKKFPQTTDMNIRRALSENVIKKLGKEEARAANVRNFKIATQQTLKESEDSIKAINDEFKFDPDVNSSETLAERIYGSDFKNADLQTKEQIITQTDNDVIKYLKVLEGAREKPKGMQLPKQETINDIVDNILTGVEDPTKISRGMAKRGFRFDPGTQRNYRFAIRDSLLNLKAGTTESARAKLGSQKGMDLDEIFSLGATFRRAPGYTEAFQFIPSKINQAKRLQIDNPLNAILDAIEQGKTEMQYKGEKVSIEKAVQLFNKNSKAFGNKNKILTPQINLGKPLDDVSAYSPEAQKNIQDVFKTKNYSLSVQKPKSKIQTFAIGAGGASLALPAQAQDQTDLLEKGDIEYGDPETWTMKVGQFIEEAPTLSATAAAATPLLTKPGRKIYGQAAKQILKGAGKVLSGAGTPLGLVTANLGFGIDPASSFERALLGTELALSPLAVKEAAKFGPRVQQVMNLGLTPAMAARFARFASPVGIATLGAEGAYQFYQALEDEKARIAAMSPEERQMFEEEQTAAAYMGEAENFAYGGRVGMKIGGDPKDKKKTPFDKPTLPIDPNAPQDPGRRTFMEGMGLGGLGIAGLLTGAVKFAPEIKKAVTGVTTQITEVPNIVKELYATIKSLGKVTDYGKKGTVKTELGNYTLVEEPGGYSITKMTDSDFRYQQEYFGVRTDPEYGVVEYEELTALPDMDGKLKDVDFGVELNTYREIGEDLAKIRNDDSLIRIADEDTIKQIEKEEALKESLGKKGMGEND